MTRILYDDSLEFEILITRLAVQLEMVTEGTRVSMMAELLKFEDSEYTDDGTSDVYIATEIAKITKYITTANDKKMDDLKKLVNPPTESKLKKLESTISRLKTELSAAEAAFEKELDEVFDIDPRRSFETVERAIELFNEHSDKHDELRELLRDWIKSRPEARHRKTLTFLFLDGH